VVDATGSSDSTAQSPVQTAPTGSSDPQVVLPTEQLAAKNDIALPDSLRTDAPRSTSNSHHASRSAPANPSSPIPADGHANLSYDPATNRITSAGFAYDAAGNQVRALIAGGASQRFQYDAANRLANVRTDASVIIASYTYGDSNERLVADEGGLRTYYACDGKAEYTESGSSTTPQWSKTYIYLGARLLSTLMPNGSGGEAIQYHHPDRLGTRLVTNAQDTRNFEQVTLPFGTALEAESTGATKRRFTS
jgi:YD repeat-containing protein